MTYYLDTSVAMHVLLGTSASARKWFDRATIDDEVISSRILRTEITRVLRRDGLDLAIRNQVLDHVGIIPMDSAVLLQAESIVPHVRTMDSIHLGAAIHAGIDDLVIACHDGMMNRVAAELGFQVEDPV